MYHIICLNCSKEHIAKRANSKYCCDLCRNQYNRKSKGRIQNCSYCDKEFKNYEVRKFCSFYCSTESKKRGRILRDLLTTMKKCTNKKDCRHCGKEFIAATHDNIYCSKNCCVYAYKKRENEKVAFLQRKRVSRINGLDYNYSYEEWTQAVKIFNGECAYCGRTDKTLTKEHFIPVSKGGEFTRDNIIPVCGSCNSSKGNRDFFEWYPERESYSPLRRKKILEYLNYNESKKQQLALF